MKRADYGSIQTGISEIGLLLVQMRTSTVRFTPLAQDDDDIVWFYDNDQLLS